MRGPPITATRCAPGCWGQPPTGIRPYVGTADLDLHLSRHLLDGETADYYQAIY